MAMDTIRATWMRLARHLMGGICDAARMPCLTLSSASGFIFRTSLSSQSVELCVNSNVFC